MCGEGAGRLSFPSQGDVTDRECGQHREGQNEYAAPGGIAVDGSRCRDGEDDVLHLLSPSV